MLIIGVTWRGQMGASAPIRPKIGGAIATPLPS